jgi:hypothetical protein
MDVVVEFGETVHKAKQVANTSNIQKLVSSEKTRMGLMGMYNRV